MICSLVFARYSDDESKKGESSRKCNPFLGKENYRVIEKDGRNFIPL